MQHGVSIAVKLCSLRLRVLCICTAKRLRLIISPVRTRPQYHHDLGHLHLSHHQPHDLVYIRVITHSFCTYSIIDPVTTESPLRPTLYDELHSVHIDSLESLHSAAPLHSITRQRHCSSTAHLAWTILSCHHHGLFIVRSCYRSRLLAP